MCICRGEESDLRWAAQRTPAHLRYLELGTARTSAELHLCLTSTVQGNPICALPGMY